MTKYLSLFDRTFRNKNGKITIYQPPNVAEATWIISAILSRIVSQGKLHNLFSAITFGALVTWALMEVLSGVNYFRRALGLVVLLVLIYSKVK